MSNQITHRGGSVGELVKSPWIDQILRDELPSRTREDP